MLNIEKEWRNNETQLACGQLEIEVLLEKYNIVDNHQVINVYSGMGDSDIIDQSIISFKYDDSRYECFVRQPNTYRPNERFFIANQAPDFFFLFTTFLLKFSQNLKMFQNFKIFFTVWR